MGENSKEIDLRLRRINDLAMALTSYFLQTYTQISEDDARFAIEIALSGKYYNKPEDVLTENARLEIIANKIGLPFN
jgi:hypothetical protein